MNQILSIVVDPDDRLSSIDHVGYYSPPHYYLSPQAGLKTVRSVRPAQYKRSTLCIYSQATGALHAKRMGPIEMFPVCLEAWRPYDIIHQI